ncbi:protein CHUP1, chloroplastic [Cajanus cajan]|nr:protein CHUP1, chloroplastic [Cajanus cajan]XP_020227632.1 protein CHUP1, chloroplastic [Cajanus cajan]XP_029129222.1 protein CHUP1, chloroplastic [Cajanus cajan]XP_029129223.1 protein CHUP1, chloroplastic [Cajanus cajan]
MMEKIFGRFLKWKTKEEKSMKPFLLKCGLALALTLAGFLYSHVRTKRIKPSATSPRGHPSDHGSEVNVGRGNRVASSFCSTVSEENMLDNEETCINKVIGKNSPLGLSPRTKHSGEKDEFLLPEFNDLTKEAEFEGTISGSSFKKEVETPRSRVGSPMAYTSFEKDDYEKEIRRLRSMIRMLQERETNLEVQLLEFCGLREQEAAVMELQNRLKISNMEAKMFNLKVETLQSENRRLEAQVSDHAKLMSELENAKAKVKFLKKKIRYEAEQNRELIINLKHKVSKMQDQELKAAASDHEIQIKLTKLKDLECEAEQLKKSNLRLQMENSDLARRLDSTQVLANAVLENPEADSLKEESERFRKENERLMKEMEQLHADRCSDLEELVYLRWINACLRHELRNYQPPSGKAVARDLSKSLSPTSEKKAKQLILEYANNDRRASNSDLDSDQWSSSQASFLTDSGERDDYSPLDNSSEAKANNTSNKGKSRIFGKLMKLIRGKDGPHHRVRIPCKGKAMSREDSNTSQFSLSIPNGNDTGIEGLRSENATPGATSRTSFEYNQTQSLKDESRRNSYSHTPGSSKNLSPRRRSSVDFKNRVDSFSESSGMDKSNLVKYAEALRKSDDTPNHKSHRRSAAYSSF